VARIDPSELLIDPSAVRRLAALSAKAGHPVHLRVLVDQGGCSGLEYKFNVQKGGEQPEEEDMSVTAITGHLLHLCTLAAGAHPHTWGCAVLCAIVVSVVATNSPSSVWVDRDSWLWLRGSRIEYLEELARSAFVVASNPNATQACGCKSSFAPKMDPRTGAPAAMSAGATTAAQPAAAPSL